MAEVPAVRTMVLCIFLPVVLGAFGLGMHFVPMPGFRLAAFLAAIAYCATLTALAVRIRRKRISLENDVQFTPITAAFFFVVIAGFSYVSFRMTVPALLTDVIGVPASKKFVIESLEQGSAKARLLCAYELSLEGVTTVLDDSFCASEEFARQHAAGQAIQLTGKQSRFGFRFENVN
jgi:hypothetical protein